MNKDREEIEERLASELTSAQEADLQAIPPRLQTTAPTFPIMRQRSALLARISQTLKETSSPSKPTIPTSLQMFSP